jgi:hypothetical protein
MQARLKSSKKWTRFPQEYLDQIKEVFLQTFEDQIKPKILAKNTQPTPSSSNDFNGEFRLDGRIYPEEILLRVGYLEKGRLTQANFETSIDFNPNKQNAIDSIHKCVDAIASLMLEYFQMQENPEAELDFPTTWTPYQFDGQEIFFNFNTVNTELEDEANRLLGLSEKKLIYEDEEEDLFENDENDELVSPKHKNH